MIATRYTLHSCCDKYDKRRIISLFQFIEAVITKDDEERARQSQLVETTSFSEIMVRKS
jgi:hypothetical protein